MSIYDKYYGYGWGELLEMINTQPYVVYAGMSKEELIDIIEDQKL